MLQTAEFPFPGSIAMLDGEPVRVHQQIDAGTVLVFGAKTERRVPVSALTPPPEKSLFRQWLDECVACPGEGGDPLDYNSFTPAAVAADAYRAWLAARGHAEDFPLSDYIFTRMMREAGHSPTRGLWRAPGDTQSRTRALYRFTLRKGEA